MELDRNIQIQTQLKDPTFQRNGETFIDPALVGWNVIEVSSPHNCNHIETICPECSHQWQIDHWVRIVNVECGHALGINEVPGHETVADREKR